MRLISPIVLFAGAGLLQACAGVCEPAPGDACTQEQQYQGYCDGGELTVMCHSGKWLTAEEAKQLTGIECSCTEPASFDACSEQAVSCPVPGFVGIARAQRDVRGAWPIRLS